MQLAIIGRISSSKSTLVNAILGKDGIVATGQLEITFNVSWLKYGKSTDPFIVHFKNGTTKEMKKDESWEQWTSRQKGTNLKTDVSYIEAFYDAEILKEINIIDTPGLDAQMGTDSQNTLNFLKIQKPDAVLMLFTKSIANNILQVVQQFNMGGGFNPINAMGVLAKTDTLWHTDEKEIHTFSIGLKIINGLINRNPSLKDTVFNIYPISAMMFLASQTMTDNDFASLKKLSLVKESIFECMCDSAAGFIDPDYEIPVTIEERKALFDKLGRYAIYLIVHLMKENDSVTLNDIKKIIRAESGANEFMKVINEHFGERSKLIKAESVFRDLSKESSNLRATLEYNHRFLPVIENIEQQLSDIFKDLIHFHREYELISLIYNKQIDLEQPFADEFCRLYEKSGDLPSIRLGITDDSCSLEELILVAKERERQWRIEVNLEFDKELKGWKKVIRDSYTYLWYDLKQKINK